VKFAYRSEITNQTRIARANSVPGGEHHGRAPLFYKEATVIFVGKSLTAQGGQNPIEPAALRKPVVFGPNMQNFADVVRSFLEQDGAVGVKDAAELEKALGELLADEARRRQLGCNAVKVVETNQGGILRTVEMILNHLEGCQMYVKR